VAQQGIHDQLALSDGGTVKKEVAAWLAGELRDVAQLASTEEDLRIAAEGASSAEPSTGGASPRSRSMNGFTRITVGVPVLSMAAL
jgi:hypothetical protein